MQDLNCGQVVALLTFFIDKKLNPKMMQSIEYHLNICEDCRIKYLNLRQMYTNYEEIKNKISEENDSFRDKQYKLYKANLSAYIDNELDDDENIRIKKFAITNADARQDMEDLILFREILKENFEKTKNSFKSDYSEQTVQKIYKMQDSKPKFLYCILVACLFLILCIVEVLIFAIK